jgi:hypothetical protein
VAKTHKLIMAKLEKYPPDVQELASCALELAESMPESSVFEQLKGVVRKITREHEASR